MSDAIMVPREAFMPTVTLSPDAAVTIAGGEVVTWKECLRRLAASPSVGGWEDISTAPKDGTMLLVAYDDGVAKAGAMEGHQRVFEARWNDVQGTWSARNGFLLHSEATHWMPLPPPPSVSTGSRPQEAAPRQTEAAAPARFRKTATIEAVQWFKMGDHPAVILKSAPNRYADEGVPWIPTLEGGHVVTPGDWIATGAEGEHWPIKPDIFAKTYVPAEGCSSNEGAGQ